MNDLSTVASVPTVVNLSEVNTADDESVDSEFSPVKNDREIIRRCILTSFPPDKDPKWLLPNTYFNDTSCIDIWCGQFEICPDTERLHFHIYVHFKNDNPIRFTSLRKLFVDLLGSVNIVKPKARYSKNSEACVVNYVLAPDKRADSTLPFIWPHNKRKVDFNPELWDQRKTKKSKRDELKDEQVEYIESKPKWWNWDQIVHESIESKKLLANCSWGAKYHAGRHAEAPRRIIKNVIVMYGAGGTGKTTLASKWDTRDDEDFHERYYKRNPDDGKFWGGGKTAYRGQRIIHLEEYCGQEACSAFKEICDLDKHGPSVNIKNSGIDLNHDTVIITSNHHPAAWYRHLWAKEPKQWHPVARRFTQVWFFPDKRPDGSDNVPTDVEPPHYVDQTEEFASFARCYEDALHHASVHWPLPGPTDEFTSGVSHSSNFVYVEDPKVKPTIPIMSIRGGGPEDDEVSNPEDIDALSGQVNAGDKSPELLELEERIIDILGDPSNWPATMRSIFNMKRLTQKTRFSFQLFTLTNGLDPDLFLEWFICKHNPSQHNLNQVKNVIEKYPTSQWTSWDMVLKRRR